MSGADRAWLDELEAAVKEAAGTIETLREEKADLARRAEELEARVEGLEAELEGASGKGKKTSDEKAAQAWREERKEIRKRVDKLTKRLEGLLDES